MKKLALLLFTSLSLINCGSEPDQQSAQGFIWTTLPGQILDLPGATDTQTGNQLSFPRCYSGKENPSGEVVFPFSSFSISKPTFVCGKGNFAPNGSDSDAIVDMQLTSIKTLDTNATEPNGGTAKLYQVSYSVSCVSNTPSACSFLGQTTEITTLLYAEIKH